MAVCRLMVIAASIAWMTPTGGSYGKPRICKTSERTKEQRGRPLTLRQRLRRHAARSGAAYAATRGPRASDPLQTRVDAARSNAPDFV
jgi:hypothetical protein